MGIKERVKTFENACDIAGIDPRSVPEDEHILVIIYVINEGWISDYEDDSQEKYRVWNEFKKGSGWCYCGSYYFFVNSYSGARLDIESKEKAEYIGKNFRPEWSAYLSKSLIDKYKKIQK